MPAAVPEVLRVREDDFVIPALRTNLCDRHLLWVVAQEFRDQIKRQILREREGIGFLQADELDVDYSLVKALATRPDKGLQ